MAEKCKEIRSEGNDAEMGVTHRMKLSSLREESDEWLVPDLQYCLKW